MRCLGRTDNFSLVGDFLTHLTFDEMILIFITFITNENVLLFNG